MRRHAEREGHSNTERTNLGLTDRARFCTVIRQTRLINGVYHSLVVEMYPNSVEPDALTGRVTELVISRQTGAAVYRLNRGEEYPAIHVQGGKVERKKHNIDDGIIC